MVVDKKYIKELRRNRIEISIELEEILIDRLGEEPEPYSFSEQDRYEQSRSIIERYRTPKGRLELLYGVDKLEGQLKYMYSRIQWELREKEEDF